ncbi:MAG: hypothetical protein HQL69_17485 [Magnetococcales bacterium]|nr:hypothetical protein [Magnetococcales bacterium]
MNNKNPKSQFTTWEIGAIINKLNRGLDLEQIIIEDFSDHMVYLRFCNSPVRDWQSICVGITPFALYPLACEYDEIVAPSFNGFAVRMGFVAVTIKKLVDPSAEEDALLVFRKYCPDLDKCVFSTLEKMIAEKRKSSPNPIEAILNDDTLTLARKKELQDPAKEPTSEERVKHIEENDTLLFEHEKKRHEVMEREDIEKAWLMIGALAELGYLRSVMKEDTADWILSSLSLLYIVDFGDGAVKFLKPFEVEEHVDEFKIYIKKVWDSLLDKVDKFEERDVFLDFGIQNANLDEKRRLLIMILSEDRIYDLCMGRWSQRPDRANPFKKMVEYYDLPEGSLPFELGMA